MAIHVSRPIFFALDGDPFKVILTSVNCVFAKNMKDAEIYLVATSNTILWGKRIYYFNCHRESGNDYSWYANRLPEGLQEKDITVQWVFGSSWNPTIN